MTSFEAFHAKFALQIIANQSATLKQGQFFSGNDYRVYLLGNPIIWWANLAFLAVYLLVKPFILVRKQRGCQSEFDKLADNDRFVDASVWLFIGWFIHYAPFYGR